MNKLKEINGKYYQEVEVVMLATDKATWPNCIWLGRISNQLRLDTSYNNNPKSIPPIDDSMLPQHLYFLSNEEIKEGDWYFDPYENKILQCLSHMVYINTMMRKVIATTDTSLRLPQPSKSFIQAYIKAYNEGNPITKVLVEYIYPNTINFGNCIYKEINGDGSYYELINGEVEKTKSLNELINLNAEVNFRLKVNSSNEITIKKVKDSWTREEVIIDIEKAMIQGLDLGQYRDKWIEKNL